MKVDEPPIVLEEELDASPEQVWKALTVADEMRQWFFDNTAGGQVVEETYSLFDDDMTFAWRNYRFAIKSFEYDVSMNLDVARLALVPL